MASHPGAKILVVDDIEDNRDLLTRRLGRLGYASVVTAADGAEALQKLGEQAFDLVLLDVMMPVIGGVEVLTSMRDQGRLEDTPVLMISAATEIETVVRCLELGAEDYLPKPFNPLVLKARVTSVLEKKFLRAEVRRQFARLAAELAQARSQQLSMLPTEFPQPSSQCPVETHAVLHPAQEVGGDLYDFFEVGPDTICLAVGDVSGKGLPAALFMARTRSLLRAGTLQFLQTMNRVPQPSELVATLNEELCKNNPESMFVTLFVGFLDLRTGLLRYVNAGHVPPVLVRAGVATAIGGPADLPLGALHMIDHTDAELALQEGDALVIMTDGIGDTENVEGRDYTLNRALVDLTEMANAPAAELTAGLLSRVLAFAGEAPQFDDITVLAIRIKGLKDAASPDG